MLRTILLTEVIALFMLGRNSKCPIFSFKIPAGPNLIDCKSLNLQLICKWFAFKVYEIHELEGFLGNFSSSCMAYLVIPMFYDKE